MMFGSAGFVPKVQTVEFGSTGKGSNFQLFPKSLDRAMAPDDPGVKSPHPSKRLFASAGCTAIPRRQVSFLSYSHGMFVCMPNVLSLTPLSALAYISRLT